MLADAFYDKNYKRGSNDEIYGYYALLYGANDMVLIVLWVLASLIDTRYISVVVCFVVFLVNDLYGYFSWKKMERRQINIS